MYCYLNHKTILWKTVKNNTFKTFWVYAFIRLKGIGLDSFVKNANSIFYSVQIFEWIQSVTAGNLKVGQVSLVIFLDITQGFISFCIFCSFNILESFRQDHSKRRGNIFQAFKIFFIILKIFWLFLLKKKQKIFRDSIFQ